MSIKIDKNVCRVCLTAAASISLIKNAAIKEKFQYATQISIRTNDELPTNLCRKCEARLNISCDFRTQSIESDRHLRSFITKMNHQFKRVAAVRKMSSSLLAANELELQVLMDAGYDPLENLKDEFENNLDEENVEENESDADGPDEGKPLLQARRKSKRLAKEAKQDASSLKIENTIKIHNPSTDQQFDTIEDQIDSDSDFSCVSETPKETINILETKTKSSQKTIKMNQNRLARKTKQKIKQIDWKCEICHKIFNNKQNLSRHSLIHNNVKRFECELCFKKFSQSNSLRLHMLIHTDQRPHTCPICSKSFRQAASLKRHIFDRHSDEDIESKVYPCMGCSKVFYSAFSLEYHSKKHKKGPQYECRFCNDVLASRTGLKYHEDHCKQRIDDQEGGGVVRKVDDCRTAEKVQWDCHLCPGIFYLKEKYDEHIKSHEDEMVQCDFCVNRFTSEGQLNMHMIEVHGNSK